MNLSLTKFDEKTCIYYENLAKSVFRLRLKNLNSVRPL